jgi:hypothetical protein
MTNGGSGQHVDLFRPCPSSPVGPETNDACGRTATRPSPSGSGMRGHSISEMKAKPAAPTATATASEARADNRQHRLARQQADAEAQIEL